MMVALTVIGMVGRLSKAPNILEPLPSGRKI